MNVVSDDYENLAQIVHDVRQETSELTAEGEIRNCLLRLVRVGLVAVFEYDASTLKYNECNLEDEKWNSKWFTITEKGRSELAQS